MERDRLKLWSQRICPLLRLCYTISSKISLSQEGVVSRSRGEKCEGFAGAYVITILVLRVESDKPY